MHTPGDDIHVQWGGGEVSCTCNHGASYLHGKGVNDKQNTWREEKRRGKQRKVGEQKEREEGGGKEEGGEREREKGDVFACPL